MKRKKHFLRVKVRPSYSVGSYFPEKGWINCSRLVIHSAPSLEKSLQGFTLNHQGRRHGLEQTSPTSNKACAAWCSETTARGGGLAAQQPLNLSGYASLQCCFWCLLLSAGGEGKACVMDLEQDNKGLSTEPRCFVKALESKEGTQPSPLRPALGKGSFGLTRVRSLLGTVQSASSCSLQPLPLHCTCSWLVSPC